MSAVVVKGGRVLAMGVNRDKPGYLKSRLYALFQGVHAEVDAVLQCDPDELRGAELYVVGHRPRSGALITSKPCEACQSYLADVGLKAVYYHEPDGVIRRLGLDEEPNYGVVPKAPHSAVYSARV